MLCAGNGLQGETGESNLKKPLRETERVYGKQIHKATAAASSSSATNADSFSRCKDKHVGATNAMTMTIESFNAGPSNMIPSGIYYLYENQILIHSTLETNKNACFFSSSSS